MTSTEQINFWVQLALMIDCHQGKMAMNFKKEKGVVLEDEDAIQCWGSTHFTDKTLNTEYDFKIQYTSYEGGAFYFFQELLITIKTTDGEKTYQTRICSHSKECLREAVAKAISDEAKRYALIKIHNLVR